MGIIVPSILTASKADLEQKLTQLRGLVDTVQIDVVDGRFASPATWPYSEGSEELAATEGGLHALGDFRYEVDLMTLAPEVVAGAWIAAGASRVVVHMESVKDLPVLIETLERNYGYDKDFSTDLLSIGLALNIDTDTAVLEPYLSKVAYVQFMGISHIGRQGEPFDERVLEKIRAFHKAHPDIVLQVDGGATYESAPALLSAGVDRLVVGHGLWEAENLAAELARLEELGLHYGTYE